MTDRRGKSDEIPSLLDRESRGGDVAEGGFAFQESVVMSYVPAWLAHEGFEEMTQESMGDAEAKFFVPGRPLARELVEVKNHRVMPAEFWKEVGRFQRLDRGSPGTFAWFTLVVKELGEKLKRLRSGLKRTRDPYSFYEGTAVADESFAKYVEMVVAMGRTEEDARFLFERVEIRDDLTTDEAQWRAIFGDRLATHLPEYEELPRRVVRSVYEGLGDLLRSRRNQNVTRGEIEQRLREHIPEPDRLPVRPVVLCTANEAKEGGEGKPKARPICFAWEDFFRGDDRSYPSPLEWDDRLVGELRQTREWILRYRATRRIRLTGSRRLSASLAIGATFSAVAGFSIEMEGRGGEVWATDAYPTAATADFPLSPGGALFAGDRLVVSVGVTRDFSSEVEESLDALGLAGSPTLHLYSEQAVLSAEHANKAAGALKNAILEALSRTGGARVDLFFAGPSFLALSLGHRINAVATVRCYEWSSRGLYVRTCELPS